MYACDSAALIYLERYNNDSGPVHIFSKQTNKQDETTPKKKTKAKTSVGGKVPKQYSVWAKWGQFLLQFYWLAKLTSSKSY